jgi:Domain of unknown function (DUF4150)
VGCTVFANGQGFFHKSSGGSGKAFPDVCLSPPPPPTGPVPVPYNNLLNASDLTEGSQTVKIQGSPTALENQSYVTTSSGDEGGTQGGNVLTHKTKGTGYFMLWSFDVKVEGKGVCRHDDPMGQNCASHTPLGAADIKAKVEAAWRKALDPEIPCEQAYNSDTHHGKTTKSQKRKVAAGPCWQCGSPSPAGWATPPAPPNPGVPAPPGGKNFIPDHVPPLVARWYSGECYGANDPAGERAWNRKRSYDSAVEPHCHSCSNSQGQFSEISQTLADIHARLVDQGIARFM